MAAAMPADAWAKFIVFVLVLLAIRPIAYAVYDDACLQHPALAGELADLRAEHDERGNE